MCYKVASHIIFGRLRTKKLQILFFFTQDNGISVLRNVRVGVLFTSVLSGWDYLPTFRGVLYRPHNRLLFLLLSYITAAYLYSSYFVVVLLYRSGGILSAFSWSCFFFSLLYIHASVFLFALWRSYWMGRAWCYFLPSGYLF